MPAGVDFASRPPAAFAGRSTTPSRRQAVAARCRKPPHRPHAMLPITALPEPLEPGVLRLTAPNPSPYTYTGTQTYSSAPRDVAVIDPGPPTTPRISPRCSRAIAGRAGRRDPVHPHPPRPQPGRRAAQGGDRRADRRLRAARLDDDGPRADAAFDPDYRARPRAGRWRRRGGRRLDARRGRDPRPYLQPSRLRAAPRAARCSPATMSWAGRPASSRRPTATWAPTWPASTSCMQRDDRVYYPGHGDRGRRTRAGWCAA